MARIARGLLLGLLACVAAAVPGGAYPPTVIAPIDPSLFTRTASPAPPTAAPRDTATPPATTPVPLRKRPTPRLPEPRLLTVEAPVATEKPRAPSTSSSLRGEASWYCRAGASPCHYLYPDGPGFDAYAAAGAELRRAIGPGWRNNVVSVNGIRVKLVDWCGCPAGRIIDLYYDVASALSIAGVGQVTVRW